MSYISVIQGNSIVLHQWLQRVSSPFFSNFYIKNKPSRQLFQKSSAVKASFGFTLTFRVLKLSFPYKSFLLTDNGTDKFKVFLEFPIPCRCSSLQKLAAHMSVGKIPSKFKLKSHLFSFQICRYPHYTKKNYQHSATCCEL